MKEVEVKIKFTDEEARKFSLKSPYNGDAGTDIRVCLDKKDRSGGLTIYPGDRVLVSAGFKMQLPEGYWALITHRSSTENKLRLRVISGVIDQGYRGPLYTQVQNPNTFPVTINHGDRLSQMILHEIIVPKFQFLDDDEELDTSDRGENGFGSSNNLEAMKS